MTIHEFAQLWFDKWRSAVEILLLSVVIYYGYLYFRGTRGAKVLTGMAIVFLTLTLISQLLNLVVISFIIRSFSVFLAVALVVIFQPELRRALAELGKRKGYELVYCESSGTNAFFIARSEPPYSISSHGFSIHERFQKSRLTKPQELDCDA
jgi:diadenylate cyclase